MYNILYNFTTQHFGDINRSFTVILKEQCETNPPNLLSLIKYCKISLF